MKYIEGYLFSKGARGSTCEASLTPLNTLTPPSLRGNDKDSELSLKDLMETCEVIGYENLFLEDSFVENPRSHCDTFYIDLIGIKGFRFGLGVEWIWFFGGKNPDELSFENDGTLMVRFN